MALAIMTRSPNSCVISFRYGVSPHPAQAPENSNSGWSIWLPLTEPRFTLVRSISGIERKNSKFSFSTSR